MNGSGGRTRDSVWIVWLLSALVGLAGILVVINIFVFLGNRSIQTEVNQRQQFINETIRLNQLNNQMIQSLVSQAAQSDDQQIRNMLAANGVTFVINQPAEPPAGSSSEDEAEQDDAAPSGAN